MPRTSRHRCHRSVTRRSSTAPRSAGDLRDWLHAQVELVLDLGGEPEDFTVVITPGVDGSLALEVAGARRAVRDAEQAQRDAATMTSASPHEDDTLVGKIDPRCLPPGVPDGPAEHRIVVAVPMRKVGPRRLREGQPEHLLDGFETHGKVVLGLLPEPV
ncbi:MAG: hypothetical protein LC799_23515, partial [Actinobacteria bacterium]|nr:hypothetical protein [Actinomycetota bacterium]